MENLFRFMLIRPASTVDPSKSIPLEKDTPLLGDLREKKSRLTASEFNVALKNTVTEFVASNEYKDSVEKLNFGTKLRDFDKLLRSKDPMDELNSAMIEAAVKETTGKSVDELIADQKFQKDQNNVIDSIIAIKLLRSEHSKPIAEITRILRLMELIDEVRTNPEAFDKKGSVLQVLKRPLQLPSSIFPLVPENLPKMAGPVNIKDTEQWKILTAAQDKVKKLQTGIEEFLQFKPTDLFTGSPQVSIEQKQTVQETKVLFALKPEASRRLSNETRELLESMELDETRTPIDYVVANLKSRMDREIRTIANFEPKTKTRNVSIIGNTPIEVEKAYYYSSQPTVSVVPTTTNTIIPYTHGSVKPAGVADLLIVRQELKRYQAREIAHIENVLQGELKLREHRRRVTTEELLLTETETSKEEERDLESTERFEMQKEVAETIKQDASLEGGIKISGSYGMAIKFEASANGAISNSQERSTKFATEYASEITSRSVSKITERFKEQRMRRVVQEIEEINRHELNNVSGRTHVTGIYQWVDKVYEAQVFNYGLRTMYEFMIPEPAAYFIEALKKNYDEASGLEKPKDFTIMPDNLDEINYLDYIRDYEVTGVEPYPEPFITISKTFNPEAPMAGGPPNFGQHIASAELTIDDGYVPFSAKAEIAVTPSGAAGSHSSQVIVIIGDQSYRFHIDKLPEWHGSSSLFIFLSPAERKTIPISVISYEMVGFALTIEILCQRTTAIKKWQMDTYEKILQAYQQKRREYEEKLAAFKAQAGVEIAGRNPLVNRKLEQDELKKACISILTRQHFDLFNSIETGSDGMPQVNIFEAEQEGEYIRFFEQAFEWENMTYVFYPYFWGRKDEWVERISYQDVDPLFEAFLKAGAARVTVPVRLTTEQKQTEEIEPTLGFEAAIDHFMNTGEIWNGGGLPTITSDLYVPIIEEYRERLGAPGDEVAQGEPWEVTLPTNLVKLRNDDSLPKWRKDENGNWVPDE